MLSNLIYIDFEQLGIYSKRTFIINLISFLFKAELL